MGLGHNHIMKTYGLLSTGNVQMHFVAVSLAAVPSPISYTTVLISFTVWERFFRERALTRLKERCGCKGNFIVSASGFLELEDVSSSSLHPRLGVAIKLLYCLVWGGESRLHCEVTMPSTRDGCQTSASQARSYPGRRSQNIGQ